MTRDQIITELRGIAQEMTSAGRTESSDDRPETQEIRLRRAAYRLGRLEAKLAAVPQATE